ncbi:MAG: hypothetical protein IPM11_00625 [Micropruina sp.]|nr:hypothetical protein [Micropruina sp.]
MDKPLGQRALIEAAILKQLSEANSLTRDALTDALVPGERVPIYDDDVEIGTVAMTKPGSRWRVEDQSAFLRWVEANAPQAIITIKQVSPAFTDRIIRDGELITAEGECLIPDGLVRVTTRPQLRVEPSNEAHHRALQILGRLPELEA